MAIRRLDIDRPVTPEEVAILRWLLDNASVGDIAAYRMQKLEDLRVVEVCDCGCVSAMFESDNRAVKMIADANANYPDGQQANLILWGKEGRITWLEVNDMHPNASHRMPAIADLRRWEEYFPP
jgi:hypothetical protein